MTAGWNDARFLYNTWPGNNVPDAVSKYQQYASFSVPQMMMGDWQAATLGDTASISG
jgi:hypothetical protein